MTDLGVLGRIEGIGFSAAAGINESGAVVGMSTTSNAVHAFRWTSNGGLRDLGVIAELALPEGSIGISAATAISNGGGQVVGLSTTLDSIHSFLWSDRNGMQDLGTLGGAVSVARGVNDREQVVGASATTDAAHAFIWSRQTGMQDLGTLGGTFSLATGINQGGQVVGASLTSTGDLHAFVWTRGSGMRDLGTLGGSFSVANAIDEIGRVVGLAATPTEAHAFVWTEASGMQDLGVLIDAPGLGLSEALAISPNRIIVGAGTTSSGSVRALSWALSSAQEASR
jgi:probable HAF family extracellular repeat protein